MKKKHGWILQEKFLFAGDCRFFRYGGGHGYQICKAHIFDSRQAAAISKLYSETIRKVSLTSKGKAKKIIGLGRIKKRYAWVLKLKVEPKVLPEDYARLLKDAWPIETRKEAREEKYSTDTIEKVLLSSKGIPIQVMGRV